MPLAVLLVALFWGAAPSSPLFDVCSSTLLDLGLDGPGFDICASCSWYMPKICVRAEDNAATLVVTNDGTVGNGHFHVLTSDSYSAPGKINLGFSGISDTEYANGFGTWVPTGQSLLACAWLEWTGGLSETVFQSPYGGADAVAMYGGSGTMYFAVNTASGAVTATQTMPQDGIWRHVCGWYDGANVHISVDTVEGVAQPQTGDLVATPSFIMFNYTGTGYAWAYEIDDVRLYDTIPAADMRAVAVAIYNEGVGTPDCNLCVRRIADAQISDPQRIAATPEKPPIRPPKTDSPPGP